MTDLREKVAREIGKAMFSMAASPSPYARSRHAADAAIAAVLEALKEPSGEMLQAGNRVWLDGGNDRQIFQAMLTAFTCDHYLSALAEEDGKLIE